MSLRLASFAALVCFAIQGSPAASPGWASNTSQLRRAWNLKPADPVRPDLWLCQSLTKGSDRILVRIDSAKDGSVKSLEWLAESGVRAQDLGDDAFWAILDGTSLDAEWTEADPDILPKSFLKSLDVSPSQGFLCRACKPRLVAATLTRHGATGIRIAPLAEASLPLSVGLAAGVTEDGLRSLAAQKNLIIEVANPCRDKRGICSMQMSGDAGQKWTFRRRDGKSAWSRLEATYQAGAWWSSEWDWDSLRIESPREFKSVIGEWIGSEADVVASKLLSPIEPVLGFSVAAWKSRELPGLRVRQVSDSIARLPAPPSSLVLARSERLDFEIDAFGRRIVKIGENLK